MSNAPDPSELSRILEEAERLPSMPAVAAEMLRLIDDETSSLDDFAAALSMDPALAGKVLKMANSGLFALGAPVTTLQRATMVLGLKTVKLMSLSFSLVGSLPVDDEGGFEVAQFWRRSVVCSAAAKAFSTRVGGGVGDEAFLCGLMGHIGELVVGTGLPESWSRAAVAAGGWPAREQQRSVLGWDGAAVGGALLRSWSLPRLITDVVACGGDRSLLPEDALEQAADLARILEVSLLCAEFACGADPSSTYEQLRQRCAHFELDEDDVQEFLGGLDVAVDQTAEMLDVHMSEARVDEILEQMRVELVKQSLDVVGEIHQVERRAAVLEMDNRRLLDKAYTDLLTDLPNRAFFDETLDRCIEHRDASGTGPGLLIIDVDHFKRVNDEYGHQVGDEVLKRVAASIRGAMRENELAARYGGEEFGAILPRVNARGLAAAAERLRVAVEQTSFEAHEAPITVTVSVGGACMGEASAPDSKKDLIETADRALYEAKGAGRNRCVIDGETS